MSSGARLCIDKEILNLELNMENNYKDKAYESYLSSKDMIESFYEQGQISKWRYGRYNKKMKKYDEIYRDENEENVEE